MIHNTLNDVIPLFEHQHQVDIQYFHDPMNMSYKISMRLGDRAIMKQVSEFDMLSYGEALDVLIAMHYELLHQEIKPPEPEKVEPKETPPPTNCPNCGAGVTGRQCEYCGTIHWWFEEKEEEPETINCYADGKLVLQLKAENQKLQSAARTEALFADAIRDIGSYIMTPSEVRVAMGLNALPHETRSIKGHYCAPDMPFGVKKPEQSPDIVLEPIENPLKKLFKRRKK